MATIKDVAKLAGVSTATVSAAINGTAFVSPKLKARVDQAIVELGYATDGIARSLKKGKSSLIGLIVDDVTSPFYAELVEEIETLAHQNGYTVLLCHTGRDVKKERDYVRLLRTHRVDGIVWAPTGGAVDYPVTSLKQFTVPVVFIDRAVPTFSTYDSVILNNHAAGLKATNYLLDLGHRQVAMISGPDFLEPARERTRGFRDAFHRRRLPVREDLILDGNFREAQAFEECRKLFETGEKVSAILVANNPMFIGVMRAVSLAGRSCPQDISIVSIDDFPLADALRPHVTAIRQPVREMAQASLRLLLERITGAAASEPTHLLFEPLLIVRDSCAPFAMDQTAA